MSDDAQPLGGSASDSVLTIDAAVDQLTEVEARADKEDETSESTEENSPTEPEEATTAEADDEGEPATDDTPEDTESEDDDVEQAADSEDVDDAETEGEADDEPIAPPSSWNKDARAEFEKLPREAQTVIAAREEERDTAVAKSLSEAKEARDKADAEASNLAAYKTHFDQLIAQGQQAFADRWEGVNWEQAAEELDPKDYQRARAEFDRDQDALKKAQEARVQAETVEHAAFLKAEREKLPTVAPDLVDSEKGGERMKELKAFLNSQGIDDDAIRWASASDLSLAYDAMRWRKSQERAKAQPKPKAKPKSKTVKPVKAASTQTSQAKRAARQRQQFGKTRTIDDAVAFLNAVE